MLKRTEKLSVSAIKRPKLPARAMPVIAARNRAPGWVSAKAVGSFVPGLTKKAFEKFGFSTAALITDWHDIAGAQFASFTAPVRLKWPALPGMREGAGQEGGRPGATLVLKVDPARALDAEYGARQIVDRINAYFGYRAVAEIRLVQAPLPASALSPLAERRLNKPKAQPANPPAETSEPEARLQAALARLKAGMSARPAQ